MLKSGGAGLEVEKRASNLPWMGRRPPAHRGRDETTTPDTQPSPKLFDHDPFAAHEDLRGKSASELKEYFEGPPNEDGSPVVTPQVSHISQ